MKITSDTFRHVSGMGTGGYIGGSIIILAGSFLWWADVQIIGGVIIVFGFLIGTLRWSFKIDRQKMKLTKKHGLFFPFMPTTSKSIFGSTGLLLVKQPWYRKHIRNYGDAPTFYIDLEHPAGNIRIEQFDDEIKGKEIACLIGDWLNLPVQSIEYARVKHINMMIRSWFKSKDRYGKPEEVDPPEEEPLDF